MIDIQYFGDTEAILESLKDDLMVTDINGIILKATKSTAAIYGLKYEDLIGSSIYELERAGIMTPILTPLVIQKQEKVTLVQLTMTGKKLLVTGLPVLNAKGDVYRIVSYSHDVTDLLDIQNYLHHMQDELELVKLELQSQWQQKFLSLGLVADDPAMSKIMETIHQVAEVDVSTVLLGESGVGKTAIARYIHNEGPRKTGPFIEVNCGSIPESLFEAEFFGYEAGSFTGAKKSGKVGLAELAEGGTLFLDEVGELSLENQVKILKLIEEKQFYRVGGTKPRKVDFRLIAATHRNLKEFVEEKKFRQDLYFRLNVIPIIVPPLRERPADLMNFIYLFLNKFCKQYERERELDEAVIQFLLRQKWEGNVRELMNLMERLVITSRSRLITIENIPDYYKQEHYTKNFSGSARTLTETLEIVEKEVLLEAKRKHKKTVKIAEALGISQPSVVRKLKKYGIN
ncbi:sigma-54 interaction domain-containing protein [Ectobacillus panaciterrae]|uniref:sigma-54 interaction domain-containing protein n=1 Tax=Ectobacillus panaciterrae TaxID=363872 RepID=UPI0003F5578B|nr:sigma 54-interacting transcriptional regulator [Ectobacillus panaciterrae]